MCFLREVMQDLKIFQQKMQALFKQAADEMMSNVEAFQLKVQPLLRQGAGEIMSNAEVFVGGLGTALCELTEVCYNENWHIRGVRVEAISAVAAGQWSGSCAGASGEQQVPGLPAMRGLKSRSVVFSDYFVAVLPRPAVAGWRIVALGPRMSLDNVERVRNAHQIH